MNCHSFSTRVSCEAGRHLSRTTSGCSWEGLGAGKTKSSKRASRTKLGSFFAHACSLISTTKHDPIGVVLVHTARRVFAGPRGPIGGYRHCGNGGFMASVVRVRRAARCPGRVADRARPGAHLGRGFGSGFDRLGIGRVRYTTQRPVDRAGHLGRFARLCVRRTLGRAEQKSHAVHRVPEPDPQYAGLRRRPGSVFDLERTRGAPSRRQFITPSPTDSPEVSA